MLLIIAISATEKISRSAKHGDKTVFFRRFDVPPRPRSIHHSAADYFFARPPLSTPFS